MQLRGRQVSPVRWPEVDAALRRDYTPDQLGGCLRLALLLFGLVLLLGGLAVVAATGVAR